ncbi:MAG TPA: tetratricopeptide repeat protein, partial [Lamprocystis sp. (in: g-proteobacteria)]|nr:tetratricopeptide repeat protein [Lamprocystis sp. (in: g-proteobacteria)]
KPRSGAAPWLTLLLVLALPTAAVLTYLRLGSPEIIPNLESAAVNGTQSPAAAAADGQQAPALATLAQGLAERMEQNPDNLEGWLMLGRTYFALEQPAKALQAIERAYQIAPDQVAVMLAYAEALAANNASSLEGRPAELLRTALEREPTNPNARWLSGMQDFQQERFAAAVGTWQGVLNELDPAGQEAQDLRQMIAEARGRGGLPEATTGTPTAAVPTPAPLADAGPRSTAGNSDTATSTGASLQVSVTLAPTLSTQASPNDTVFVFARAAAGPPMPLAVSRIKVADLPTTVTLDDSMAVLPSMRLTSFPQVIVGARVSKSGEATPGPGDLEGQAGPLDRAATATVTITVDRVRP